MWRRASYFGPFVHGVVTIPIRAGIVERLVNLRRHGYRTALVTNNARELASIWPRMFPVAETFDVIVDSSAVGTRKPERRIFDIALKSLGVRADEAVLFDDLVLNIDAARVLARHPRSSGRSGSSCRVRRDGQACGLRQS